MTGKNKGISAYNRLRDLATTTKRNFQELLMYYAMERVLYRLSKSKYADRFVLKGALLLHSLDPSLARSTKDIDLLGRFDNSLDQIASIFREICNIKTEDGLQLDEATIETLKIKEDAEYEGGRVSFIGHLGSARIPIQIDIGFGDAVNPPPTEIEFPTLLNDPAPRLKGYPKETVVAEKLQALVQLQMLNSRIKDFYDLWFLLSHLEFDGASLQKAIIETFKRRKTELELEPVGLSESFAKDATKQAQWKAISGPTSPASTLRECPSNQVGHRTVFRSHIQ